MAKYDFEYIGKKYKWIKDYQGIIDCTCKSCKDFVGSLVKRGRLREIK